MPETVPAHIIEWLEREKRQEPDLREQPQVFDEDDNERAWQEALKRIREVEHEQ